MKTNRKLEMSGFRINNDNILDLARFVYGEYDTNDKYGYVEFTLDSTDDILYEDNTLNFFIDGPLRRKNAKYIGLTCKNSLKSIYINIRINNGVDGSIEVHITGKNENLVNGIYKSIEDIINGWEHQNRFILNHFMALTFTASVIALLPYYFLYIMIVHSFGLLVSSLDNFTFFLTTYIPSIPFVLVIVTLMFKIMELYPAIELNTGPKHLQIEKNNRKFLYALLSVIIIPLIIGIIVGFVR